MSRGLNKSGRSTKWAGFPRKRCEFEKCKKRARHQLGEKIFCRKHFREVSNE